MKREGKLAEQYMTGLGVNPVNAYEEMLFAKRMFHQEGGKQYLHLVISCDQILRNPDVVHRIGREIAGFYKDYQSLLTTHSDTGNLHCHLIINTVNMISGKKLSQRRKDFWSFVEFANEVFERHNLPRIGSKQLYEVIFDSESDDWEDDFEEFDDAIHGRLEELQHICGVQRPIFFLDKEKERKDVVSSIARMEQSIKKSNSEVNEIW